MIHLESFAQREWWGWKSSIRWSEVLRQNKQHSLVITYIHFTQTWWMVLIKCHPSATPCWNCPTEGSPNSTLTKKKKKKISTWTIYTLTSSPWSLSLLRLTASGCLRHPHGRTFTHQINCFVAKGTGNREQLYHILDSIFFLLCLSGASYVSRFHITSHMRSTPAHLSLNIWKICTPFPAIP